MDIGPLELLVILAIVVLIFGIGRIGKVGGELGTGIRAFREGLQGTKTEEKSVTPPVENTEEKND